MGSSLYKSIQDPCAVRIFTNPLTWRVLPKDIQEENGTYSDSIWTLCNPNQVHMNSQPPGIWVIPTHRNWYRTMTREAEMAIAAFFASWWLRHLFRHGMVTPASNSASLRTFRPISPISQQTFLATMLFLVDEFSVPFFKWSARAQPRSWGSLHQKNKMQYKL